MTRAEFLLSCLHSFVSQSFTHCLLRPKIPESTWFPLSRHPPASISLAGPGGSTKTQWKRPLLSNSSASCSCPITSCLKSKLPVRLPASPPAPGTLSHQSVMWSLAPVLPSPADLCSHHPSCLSFPYSTLKA